MKKLRLFLLAFFSLGLLPGANAQQDTIKHLIFSEHRGNGPYDMYIEIANVGTETIDLSKVTLAGISGKTVKQDEKGLWQINTPVAPGNQYRLSGTLNPGETWMCMNVSDRYLNENNPSMGPDHRLDLLAKADWINHAGAAWGFSKDTIPEWEMWGFDSIDVTSAMMWSWGTRCFVLYNHLDNGDSVMIDQFKMELNGAGVVQQTWTDVAGVEDATRYNTLVRKASVKTGNMVWANSAGIDAVDSEWQVIPNQPLYSRRSFTTVKTHGAFQLDVSSSVVDVDIPNTKMTVPWGIYRGDSILRLLDIGPGQAWEYVWNSSFADSTHAIITNGDVLTIYTTGNELKKTDFELTVAAPAADQANVFPVRDKRFNDNTPPVGYWAQPYYVTSEEPVIDTIGNVPYAARVDSLFKYLEKAPLASWEIVWKDSEVRADLQNGDILKVTAENGTTIKEYFIDVQDYAFSDNVNLNAITWPDKSEFLENWKDDTIPQFTPNKTLYTVIVPYGTKNVPALVAHPADINSKLTTKRAVSLTGSLEERSTVFTVTSESDTLTRDYKVIFELEKEPAKVQLYKGDPFFSEVLFTLVDFNSFVEIVNPGGVALDMSEYLIVRTQTALNPGDAITSLQVLTPTEALFQHRYRSYVPGYKFYEDTVSWMVNPGILSIDANVDPIVEPGGTFVLALSGFGRQQYIQQQYLPLINKHWIGVTANIRTIDGVNVQTTPPFLVRGASAIWLFKIENDAVLEGTKAVGDPLDYRLVDVLGDPVDDGIWNIAGRAVKGNNSARMRMKPDIYKGTTSLIDCMARFGTDADNSGWILEWYNVDYGWQAGPEYIGSHVMNQVTAHLSTVTSPVYLVSDGYAGVQTIQGDLASTTVEVFFGNLTKADTAQTLSIHSGVDGSVKDAASTVVETDNLVVISADGTNTTSYALIDNPLDANAVLTTENTDLTIAHTGASGTITGVVYGSLLKDIVADVNVPSLAVMHIINSKGELIPMQQLDNNLVKVDTKVGDDVYFEVTAQDQVTVITYKLEPAALSSDAFVISTLYSVDQDNNVIEGLDDGTSMLLFYKNIEVVKGATSKVFTKLGHERVDGQLAYDDVLQVVSEDATVTRTYFINFLNETNPDSNSAPEIMLAFSDSTIAVPGTLLFSATADDDGLPPPANLTYLWEVTSDNAADVVIETPDALETNVTFNAKGEYTLSLSVSDGALVSKANVVVTVGIVGVNNSITPSLRLYPNPAKNKLTIELTNMPEQTSIVSIYNVIGSVVYNTKLSTAKSEIDISGFESGLYFIKIDSGNRSFTQHIQIQN